MKNQNDSDVKKTGGSMAIPVAGALVGAAVMATVSNPKNQERVQVLIEKVKTKASNFMKSAKEEHEESKEKVAEVVEVVKATDKKVKSILKK